jgi:hypothetical protein
MRIKVEFSQDGLFGAAIPEDEGIDAQASAARYGEALTNHLYAEYPNVEIEVVQSINDRVQVDGQTDHQQTPWVEDIVGKVWDGNDWMVYSE